ncbi:MAG: GNAT family N-acetyltransferase, partial [Bacteroidota bacterium]|nr:GNAT family N-acetyltransferase [Bacteroidota bacterium]
QKLLPEAIINASFFAKQVSRQRNYFDGKSGDRLLQVFAQLLNSATLELRVAQQEDLHLLFNWVNEPDVRHYSLNPAPIPFAQHKSWFGQKLADKNCFIFIAELNAQPVGMIRFDISQGEAVISFLLDKNYRGKGLGTLLLQKGIEKIRTAAPKLTSISGLVQKRNIASVKAFTKAGFSAKDFGDSKHPNIFKFTMPA